MIRRFDRSPALSRLLARVSSGLARQRGLPIVIGVLLITISFIIQLISLAAPSPALDVLWSITHHIGLIVALVGLLLVQPLGQ